MLNWKERIDWAERSGDVEYTSIRGEVFHGIQC